MASLVVRIASSGSHLVSSKGREHRLPPVPFEMLLSGPKGRSKAGDRQGERLPVKKYAILSRLPKRAVAFRSDDTRLVA